MSCIPLYIDILVSKFRSTPTYTLNNNLPNPDMTYRLPDNKPNLVGVQNLSEEGLDGMVLRFQRSQNA